MSAIENVRSGISVSRPDLILLAVPLAFLVTFALGQWLVDSTLFAVAAGSLACLLVLVDGLFVNPPVPDSRE